MLTKSWKSKNQFENFPPFSMLYETYGIGTEVKAGGQARSPIAVDFPAVLRIQLEKLATQSTEPIQPEKSIKN